MTQPLLPAPHAYHESLQQYTALSAELAEAQAECTLAKAAYETARDEYDDRKRELILAGIPGVKERMSSDERDALMSRYLRAELGVVRRNRELMRAAESALEIIRIKERVAREQLHMFKADYPAAQFAAQIQAI